MKSRGLCIILLGMALVVGLAATPAYGYLGVFQSLGQVTSDAQVIVVLEVEKVSRENKVIVYKKVADLKGNHPGTQVKHHIAGGDDARDAEAILNWAAPGKTAIFFQSRASGLTCIGHHWYACAAAKEEPWWTMTRGAYETSYAYFGSACRLRSHVAALLEGKTVVVTALDSNELVAYRFLATRELPRAATYPVWRIKAGLKIAGWPRDGAKGAGDAGEVPAWVEALGHADAARRAQAAQELGWLGPAAAPALPALLKALKDKDHFVRLSAATALAKVDSGNRPGLAVLIAALKNDDTAIRRVAAEALGEIGPDAALATRALSQALKDADLGVRCLAADSLGQIGPEAAAAVPALREALQDKLLRSAAAGALGAMGPGARDAVDALAAALDDADEAYRWTLVTALARIGGPRSKVVVPFLIKAIADKRDTDMNCYRALILLEFLGPQGQDAAPVVLDGIQAGRLQRGWLTTTLSRIDPQAALPLLIADLRNEGVGGALKRYAAAYIGFLGPRAKDALPALAAAAKSDPPDDFTSICAWAAELVRGDYQAAVPLLVRALKDDRGYNPRFAGEALERLGPEAAAAIPALLVAAQDKDAKVRRLAAGALGRLGLSGWIGYTEFRTNLPGGRHPNEATKRACMVQADGTKRRVLGQELTEKPHNWTQFTGWSPDGKLAIIVHASNRPDNAALEEKQRDFRFEGRSSDSYFFNMATEELTKLTAIEDGKNWKDLAKKLGNLVHGFSISPDGKRLAYEDRGYQLFLADADGGNVRHIRTGHPFNFIPIWSGDGNWVLFLAGEHYNCHPHLLSKDGKELRKVGDRKGYKGVVDFLDVPDYHQGSSDLPRWSPDSKWIYYTAKIGKSVEVMRTTLDGKEQQLTHSKPGALHYHLAVSPSGQWLVFGSTRSGVRQLYVMPASGGEALPITNMQPGQAAMWPSWQTDTRP
jgi:TolB protein